MSCGRPLSVGIEMGFGVPDRIAMFDVSISALIAKALPAWRWQSRQWQQWTKSGSDVSR